MIKTVILFILLFLFVYWCVCASIERNTNTNTVSSPYCLLSCLCCFLKALLVANVCILALPRVCSMDTQNCVSCDEETLKKHKFYKRAKDEVLPKGFTRGRASDAVRAAEWEKVVSRINELCKEAKIQVSCRCFFLFSLAVAANQQTLLDIVSMFLCRG